MLFDIYAVVYIMNTFIALQSLNVIFDDFITLHCISI